METPISNIHLLQEKIIAFIWRDVGVFSSLPDAENGLENELKRIDKEHFSPNSNIITRWEKVSEESQKGRTTYNKLHIIESQGYQNNTLRKIPYTFRIKFKETK